jgi:hypothetical protein
MTRTSPSWWVRPSLIAAAASVVLGVVSGLVWLWLADPARWQVRDNGLVMTEAGARGQFQVVAMFVIVGVVGSLLIGWLVGRLLLDAGWPASAVAVVLTSLAAVIAWRVGVELGPPSPTTVSDAAVGDTVPARLAVDGFVPFLVWPIFGLAGLIAATWSGDVRVSERSGPARLG